MISKLLENWLIHGNGATQSPFRFQDSSKLHRLSCSREANIGDYNSLAIVWVQLITQSKRC